MHINGSNKDSDVANAFASQFSSVYCSSDNNNDAKADFEALFSCSENDNFSKERLCMLVSVESVDRRIKKLKLGKAL